MTKPRHNAIMDTSDTDLQLIKYMATRKRPNRLKNKYVQVYMTDAEFELLEQMATDAAMTKTEFMRQMFLRDGDTFRNRKNASESIQLAA